jgi:hypothetical protein
MMTAMRLDYQPYRPVPWIGVVMLLLVSIVVAMVANYFVDLNNQATVLEAKIQHVKAAANIGVAKPVVHSSVDRSPEVKRANEVLRKLTTHWDDLFVGLESAAGDKVTLLELAPDLEKHTVKINGEADNFASLMNYITALEGQIVFGPVYLQSHQVQMLDPQKPVRFSLLAVWRETP